MSTFSDIPEIDPTQHSIETVAQAAWKALQILEFKESSDWTPVKSQPTVWQIDRANTFKIYQAEWVKTSLLKVALPKQT